MGGVRRREGRQLENLPRRVWSKILRAIGDTRRGLFFSSFTAASNLIRDCGDKGEFGFGEGEGLLVTENKTSSHLFLKQGIVVAGGKKKTFCKRETKQLIFSRVEQS